MTSVIRKTLRLATWAVPALLAFQVQAQEAAPEVAIYQIVEIDLVRDAVDGFRAALAQTHPDAEIELQDAQGQPNLFPTIARQIVRSEPDLVAVIGTPVVIATVEAARQAGSDVPVIFIAMGDPVGSGLAASTEAPGGQASGSTDWIEPADSLDVVLRAVPDAARIGTVWDPSNQNGTVFHDALEQAVAALGFDFVDVSIATPGEVFLAGQSLAGRVDAILLGPDAQVIQGLPALGGMALEEGVPLFITAGDPATPGVLMGLGVDYGQLGTLAGEIAGQVLSGADPGTIPIVGLSNFTTMLNQDTATALDMTLPEGIATSVIEAAQ